MAHWVQIFYLFKMVIFPVRKLLIYQRVTWNVEPTIGMIHGNSPNPIPIIPGRMVFPAAVGPASYVCWFRKTPKPEFLML